MTNLPAPERDDPLSLTPNSPQQRIWYRAKRLVRDKVPGIGWLLSVGLIVLGGLMLLGALVSWAKGAQASLIIVAASLAMVNAGVIYLAKLRALSMRKMIEKLRGAATK